MSRSVIFYDGDCAMCNGWVQFVLNKDQRKVIEFASLQSTVAKEMLRSYGLNIESQTKFQTILYLKNEQVFNRSIAILEIFRDIGYPWNMLYSLRIIPRVLRDLIYRLIASNRYRFNRSEPKCRILTEDERQRILG